MARQACEASIAKGANELLTDTPRADVRQLQLLLGQLRAQQNSMEHAQALLLEGQRAANMFEDAKDAELSVLDRIDELSMQISQASRRKEDAEVSRLLAEREAAQAQVEELRSRTADARSTLNDPVLLEWYPEMEKQPSSSAGGDGGEGGGPLWDEATTALSQWVREMKGRIEALLPPPRTGGSDASVTPLAAVLAPLFLAIADLHRSGVTHLGLTPDAVRVRSDGSLILSGRGKSPSDGLYCAPEPEKNFSADGWSLGALLIELLTGSTPRWNQTKSCLEDATTSAALRPPQPLPAGPLGQAWALAKGLTASEPTTRVTVQAALRTPLFASLAHTDALTPLATATIPPILTPGAGGGVGNGGITTALPAADFAEPVLAAPLLAEALPADAAGDDLMMAGLAEALPIDEDLPAAEAAVVAVEDVDDAPDWLTEAAVGVGIDPVIAADDAPIATVPVVEVLVSESEGSIVTAVLDAASSLTPECELRFTYATSSNVENRSTGELIEKFFTAASLKDLPPQSLAAANTLFACADGGSTFLPAMPAPPPPPTGGGPMDLLTGDLLGSGPTAPSASDLQRFEKLGRLMGYCALHELKVSLPLPAALFLSLTRKPTNGGADVNKALAILGGYDPRAAIKLRRELARREGRGGKVERALIAVEQSLSGGLRSPILDAVRAGMSGLLGADVLNALSPGELACRLAGSLSSSVGSDARSMGEAFVFDEQNWEDDQLRDAYQMWLLSWMRNLSAPVRTAFELLAFGACVGPPRKRRTCCIASDEVGAIFCPEACLLWLPMAGDEAEFSARMSASVSLG